MFARERKEEMLAYMRVHKRAGIHELSEEFHVTGATIRSDLSELEKEGHLIRTHGGALLKEEEVTKPTKKNLRSRESRSGCVR